jgi:hypothetical protein
MTTTIYSGDDAILRRAQSQIATLKGDAQPIALPSLVGIICLAGIICACISEYFSAGVGFHAAFPVKSNGESLAGELMSLRLPIIFCLLAGDAILQAIPNRAKRVLDVLTHGLGIWAILLLLLGVGAFMFSATFLTLGNGDDQGFASHFIALALGIASAAMFTLSFLACHAMMGKLFTAVPTIILGLGQSFKIRTGEKLIRAVEAKQVKAEALRNTVADLEKPDALARMAANEAGAIVGTYTAQAHDLVESRKIRGDAELGPADRSTVPDVPLASLEQRYGDLKQYTATYFFNVLKQKEA